MARVSPTPRTCEVCNKTIENSEGDYCRAHARAHATIQGTYPRWLEAYRKLPFEEYLERVSKLAETGARVKEMAKFLLQHPERWDKSKP